MLFCRDLGPCTQTITDLTLPKYHSQFWPAILNDKTALYPLHYNVTHWDKTVVTLRTQRLLDFWTTPSVWQLLKWHASTCCKCLPTHKQVVPLTGCVEKLLKPYTSWFSDATPALSALLRGVQKCSSYFLPRLPLEPAISSHFSLFALPHFSIPSWSLLLS